MKRIDNLETWRFFVNIVQLGGLNAACAKLDLEPSTVSRAIRGLEKEIGAPLFSRTTRPAGLTQLGQASYKRALSLLKEHDSLSRFLTEDREAMAGTIRVGAHVGVSAIALTELILDFLAIYPDIHFEIKDQALSTEEELNPANPDYVDVILGYGDITTSSQIKRLYSGSLPFVACASVDYIKRFGSPKKPTDCINHRGILVRSVVRNSIEKMENDGAISPLIWKSTLIVNNPLSAKTAILRGAGINPDMSLFHCADEIESGRLQMVMPGWHRPTRKTYVCTTEEGWGVRRVREFAKWLAENELERLNALKDRFPELYC